MEVNRRTNQTFHRFLSAIPAFSWRYQDIVYPDCTLPSCCFVSLFIYPIDFTHPLSSPSSPHTNWFILFASLLIPFCICFGISTNIWVLFLIYFVHFSSRKHISLFLMKYNDLYAFLCHPYRWYHAGGHAAQAAPTHRPGSWSENQN